MRTRADIECWLTDMDGVLVHESKPIPGAAELLAQWRDTATPFLVLTNNPFYTPRDLSARLRMSGLEVPEDRIWTSALATAEFLRSQHPHGTAFVIGEAGQDRVAGLRAIGAAAGDLDGRLQRLGQVGEQRGHFLGRAVVEVLGCEAHALFVVHAGGRLQP